MATNVSEPVARMYAAALLEIGREKGIIGKIHEGLQLMKAAWDDPGFRDFFTSPRVNKEAKARAVTEALKDKVAPEFLNFVLLLIKKRREPVFDNIVNQFDRYRDEAEGRVHAFMDTAAEFDTGEHAQLVAMLKKVSGGKDVVLHVKEDKALLGGARVRMGDWLVDTTLKRRLARLAREVE